MNTEARVEALEYLVAALLRAVEGGNDGFGIQIQNEVSESLFSTNLSVEERKEIEKAIDSIKAKRPPNKTRTR